MVFYRNLEIVNARLPKFSAVKVFVFAILLMGKSAGDVAFYAYIVPFLISTAAGSIIAWAFLAILKKANVLQTLQLDRK